MLNSVPYALCVLVVSLLGEQPAPSFWQIQYLDNKCSIALGVTWNLHIWLHIWSSTFIGTKYKKPQIRQRTCAFPPTPQQLIEACGLLFQIKVKPQRDLDCLLFSTARECGSQITQCLWNMVKSHTKRVFSFFLVNCIWCAGMLFFTNGKL